MRIAIVTPHVGAILGNRVAFAIAKELARAHEVTVVAHTISSRVLPEVRSLLAGVTLEVIRTPSIPRLTMGQMFYAQLVRGYDRAIVRRILEVHARAPLDAVVVIANEGHWIGAYLRDAAPEKPPVTVVCVQEFLDHSFLLSADRDHPSVRRFSAPLYPMAHWMQAQRLEAFDGIVSISRWTATILDYLYGLPSMGALSAYDEERFRPRGATPDPVGYIAVPTVSIDARTTPIIERLHADGIRMRVFGPFASGTVPSEGFLGDEQLVEVLERARATLFLFDYEALGLIPFESLAVGTPVITFPREGPLEEHRENPNVHFASDYHDILALCRQLQGAPKTTDVAEACQRSVEPHRTPAVAASLVEVIRTLRTRQASRVARAV